MSEQDPVSALLVRQGVRIALSLDIGEQERFLDICAWEMRKHSLSTSIFFLAQVTQKKPLKQRTEFCTEFHVSFTVDNIQENANRVYREAGLWQKLGHLYFTWWKFFQASPWGVDSGCVLHRLCVKQLNIQISVSEKLGLGPKFSMKSCITWKALSFSVEMSFAVCSYVYSQKCMENLRLLKKTF